MHVHFSFVVCNDLYTFPEISSGNKFRRSDGCRHPQLNAMFKAVFCEKVRVCLECLAIQNLVAAGLVRNETGKAVRTPHPMMSAAAVRMHLPSPSGFVGIGDSSKPKSTLGGPLLDSLVGMTAMK